MKGKDIKAGVLVAVQAPNSCYSSPDCAMVVMDGAQYLYPARVSWKPAKKGVAIATQHGGGSWHPGVVPPSHIQKLWSEHLAEEAEHKAWSDQRKLERQMRENARAKVHEALTVALAERGIEYEPSPRTKTESKITLDAGELLAALER